MEAACSPPQQTSCRTLRSTRQGGAVRAGCNTRRVIESAAITRMLLNLIPRSAVLSAVSVPRHALTDRALALPHFAHYTDARHQHHTSFSVAPWTAVYHHPVPSWAFRDRCSHHPFVRSNTVTLSEAHNRYAGIRMGVAHPRSGLCRGCPLGSYYWAEVLLRPPGHCRGSVQVPNNRQVSACSSRLALTGVGKTPQLRWGWIGAPLRETQRTAAPAFLQPRAQRLGRHPQPLNRTGCHPAEGRSGWTGRGASCDLHIQH